MDESLVRLRDDGRLLCPHCDAPYRPRLTHGHCPVCANVAPGGITSTSAPADERDLAPALMAVATLANLLLLAVLAIVVLNR